MTASAATSGWPTVTRPGATARSAAAAAAAPTSATADGRRASLRIATAAGATSSSACWWAVGPPSTPATAHNSATLPSVPSPSRQAPPSRWANASARATGGSRSTAPVRAAASQTSAARTESLVPSSRRRRRSVSATTSWAHSSSVAHAARNAEVRAGSPRSSEASRSRCVSQPAVTSSSEGELHGPSPPGPAPTSTRTVAAWASGTTTATSARPSRSSVASGGVRSSASARRVATEPPGGSATQRPTTARAIGRSTRSATAPSISTVEPCTRAATTRPPPSDRTGRSTSASATGTAERFSNSTSTPGPTSVPEVATTPPVRATTSPPGTRTAVCTSGASPSDRCRTAASTDGWCQRSSAPIHQSSVHVVPTGSTAPAASTSARIPASMVPTGVVTPPGARRNGSEQRGRTTGRLRPTTGGGEVRDPGPAQYERLENSTPPTCRRIRPR